MEPGIIVSLTPEQEAEKVITEFGMTTAAYRALQDLLLKQTSDESARRFAVHVLNRIRPKVERAATNRGVSPEAGPGQIPESDSNSQEE